MNFKQFLQKWYNDRGDLHVHDLEAFGKSVVKAHVEWVSDQRNNFCAFCGLRLSDEDKKEIQPHHYHRMCRSHIKFADVYQLDVLAMRENMPAPYQFEGFFD